MDDSIFRTIKSMLGSDSDYTVFDQDIMIHINSAISVLTQLGIGPASGFSIKGNDETWTEFLGDHANIEAVKTYIYMKVRIVFDPPTSSSVLSAYQEACKELEWRMNVAVEPLE